MIKRGCHDTLLYWVPYLTGHDLSISWKGEAARRETRRRQLEKETNICLRILYDWTKKTFHNCQSLWGLLRSSYSQDWSLIFSLQHRLYYKPTKFEQGTWRNDLHSSNLRVTNICFVPTPVYVLCEIKFSALNTYIACFFKLAHHHPDWLVQITVARDALCAQCLAAIRVDIVVSLWIHKMPQVKPFVRMLVAFRDPNVWSEVQSFNGEIPSFRISFGITWAVLVKSVHVLSSIQTFPHQEFVEFCLVGVWGTGLPVINNPDSIDVSKAEHDLVPVPHAWMDMTRGVCVLSFGGHLWESRLDEEEAWGDLCGK